MKKNRLLKFNIVPCALFARFLYMADRTRCMLILSLFCATSVVAASSPARTTGTVVIKELVIVGNEQVSTDKIRRVMRIEDGSVFDENKITDALRRLFATKQFSDIQALREQARSADSIRVTIKVAEYPKVEEVRYAGNDHVDKEDLDKVVATGKGSFVRPALLGRDREAIADVYKEKGYYRVSVEDSLAIDPETKARILVYRVDEGNKVSVKHVDFLGVTAVDTDELRRLMKTKEDRWYRGGDFKPKEFEEDAERMILLFRSRGYLDAEIKDKELVFSQDGKDLDVFITMEEGQEYRVGELRWSGNVLFPDSVVSKLIRLEKGEVFDDTEFSQIQYDINSLYWDRGYIYSSVSPLKQVEDGVIDVEFEITEGNPAHVNEISIVGNTKTSEEVIRRELVLVPGDVFQLPRLRRSMREVFNLGYFAGPPQHDIRRANEDGDIDITLRVEERPAGQFRLGAGFSQLNKISGFIGVTEPNFLGRGLRVGFDWEFSKFRQNISVQFTEPWLMGTPTELSLSIYNRIQNQVRQQFFSDRRTGFSIRVGRPFPWFDYTSVFGRYSFEGVELTDFAASYTGPLRQVDWPQQTSSVGLTIVRNSTDSPFHPTDGTTTVLNGRWTGGDLLGGDVRSQRYEVTFSWFEPLFWKFVLEVKNQLGVIDGYDNPDQVPDYEKFRLGGNRHYGLRGYDFYEVVPEGNPQYVGGRFMQVMSYEVSYPIAPPTVYGLFFFEGGNTWNSFQDATLFDLRKSAGLGVRIELPMIGTVGLDYGYGMDRATGGSWEPHVTFGGAF
jgi:outer membrane protein insertion porin family